MCDNSSDRRIISGLWSRTAFEYHGEVFIKPAGRGILLREIEGMPDLEALGHPLMLDDVMSEGTYTMDIVLRRR